MSERANPFGDLGDFAPAPAKPKPKPDPALIDQVAAEHNFPSRQPAKTVDAPAEPIAALPPAEPPAPAIVHQPAPVESTPKLQPRRYRTGRNQQINIKATTETIERLYQLADEIGRPLGEVLEMAVEALVQSRRRK